MGLPTVGFVDETAMVVDPGRMINTRKVKYSSRGESGARRANLFGFMSLNGNDVAMVSATAKSIDFMSFMEAVREANPAGIVILDNATIHRSEASMRAA